MRRSKTVLIAIPVGLVLLLGVGIGLLVSAVPRSQVFTKLSDYDRVRGSLSTHPAVASFPPIGTPLPPRSVFHALIAPGQGADRICLYVPGSGAPFAPVPAAIGMPEPRMADQARAALYELAPEAEFASPTAATVLLYHQFSTFSILWTDSATGDRLYLAWLD